MRYLLATLVLMCSLAQADVTGRWQVNLIRGSSTLEQIGAATEAEAWKKCVDRIDALSETANPLTVFGCQTMRYYGTAVATCPPVPATQTRTQACPTGTSGTWTQTGTSVVSSPPGCNVTTTWAPTSPPAGSCAATGGAMTLNWTHDGLNTSKYVITYWRHGEIAKTTEIPGNSARSAVVSGLLPGTWYAFINALYCPPDVGCGISPPSATGAKVVM
jgi:fibronectin type III domain protein